MRIGLLIFTAVTLMAQFASAQEEADHTVFKWVVVDDNRIFATTDPSKFDPDNPDKHVQYQFLKELCAARYCSAFNREKVGKAAYCGNIKITCNDDRMSQKGKIRSWGMLPSQLETNWDELKGRYADGYATSRSRQIRAYAADASAKYCAWKLEPEENEFTEGSCDDKRFNVQRGAQHKIWFKTAASPGELKTARSFFREAVVKDVAVLVLGDSYASGEGNPHWLANFNSSKAGQTYNSNLDQWWDRKCHRSLLSYPSQALAVAAVQSKQLNGPVKYTFTLLSYACSGAELGKSKVVASPEGRPAWSGGILDAYEGRETLEQLRYLSKLHNTDLAAVGQGDHIIPQIEQAERDLCEDTSEIPCKSFRKPEFIVISIGGNDAGFGPVLLQLLSWCKAKERVDGKEACASDMINERIAKDYKPGMAALAKRLQRLIGDDTVVLLTQYPDITSAKRAPGETVERKCDDYNFAKVMGPERFEGIGLDYPIIGKWRVQEFLGLTASDARMAYDKILGPINRFQEQFVERYPKKWMVLGGIEAMSKQRGWCSQPGWFINFDESKARQYVLPEGQELDPKLTTGIAHPNFFGHDFMAWRLRCHLAEAEIIPRALVFSEGKGSCEAPKRGKLGAAKIR